VCLFRAKPDRDDEKKKKQETNLGAKKKTNLSVSRNLKTQHEKKGDNQCQKMAST